MSKLGAIVSFTPHNEHPQFADFATLAGIVGQVHEDGTLALLVLVPNKEPVWMDNVPAGTGHYAWTEAAGYDLARIAATAEKALEMAQAVHTATVTIAPTPAA